MNAHNKDSATPPRQAPPRRLPAMCAVLAAATVTLGYTGEARAFCRTTTCDPTDTGGCPRDSDGCLIDGTPLFWPDKCVTFGSQADGSDLRDISYTEADLIAQRAFQTWISADCGSGETPSIGVVPRGEVLCDQVEFNHDPPAPNANVIVFRDSTWPYANTQQTIALTTITFAVESGEILDADIEVNSANVELSTGDDNVTSDLQSVLTHELGHFFGLAHSRVSTATMNANYDRGDISFRSLSTDDASGICAIYPPGDTEVGECTGEAPRYGFSRYCGNPVQAEAGCFCGVVGAEPTNSSSGWLGWLGLIGLGWILRQRRSR